MKNSTENKDDENEIGRVAENETDESAASRSSVLCIIIMPPTTGNFN